jgi:hypothetical protein
MLGRIACLNPSVFQQFRQYLDSDLVVKAASNNGEATSLEWTPQMQEEITKTYEELNSKYYEPDHPNLLKYRENFFKYLGKRQQFNEFSG